MVEVLLVVAGLVTGGYLGYRLGFDGGVNHAVDELEKALQSGRQENWRRKTSDR